MCSTVCRTCPFFRPYNWNLQYYPATFLGFIFSFQARQTSERKEEKESQIEQKESGDGGGKRKGPDGGVVYKQYTYTSLFPPRLRSQTPNRKEEEEGGGGGLFARFELSCRPAKRKHHHRRNRKTMRRRQVGDLPIPRRNEDILAFAFRRNNNDSLFFLNVLVIPVPG